ncbi:hypothetical protein APV28_2731 [Comamonas testosteroni]|nr:hypothetical protein APV28_2731 [Comamonas testosteroni]
MDICEANASRWIDACKPLFALDEPAIDKVSVLLQHECSLRTNGGLALPAPRIRATGC